MDEKLKVTWYAIATAMGLILFTVLSFVANNANNRLSAAETLLSARGERIALLEARVGASGTVLDRTVDALDRINQKLVSIQISIEKQALLVTKTK